MIITKRYRREHAVLYARTWALGRNPLFADFGEIGGDCTSFVSQCLLAGSCTFDPRQPFGWYYGGPVDRAPAWAGVGFLYDYLTGSGDYDPSDSRPGPFGHEVSLDHVQEGDVIQLEREGTFYHSLLVSGFDGNDTLVCAHTVDSLDRRLVTYDYEGLRCIRVDGVRLSLPEDACFSSLLEGVSLPKGCQRS